VAWSPLLPSGCTEGPTWAEQPGVGSTLGSRVACIKGEGVDYMKREEVGCTKGGVIACTNGGGCVVQKEEE